jgi:hypothetical protein
MGIAMIYAVKFITPLLNMHKVWGVATETCVVLGIGLLVFLFLTWLMKLEEIKAIGLVFDKYFRRSENVENPQIQKKILIIMIVKVLNYFIILFMK